MRMWEYREEEEKSTFPGLYMLKFIGTCRRVDFKVEKELCDKQIWNANVFAW